MRRQSVVWFARWLVPVSSFLVGAAASATTLKVPESYSTIQAAIDAATYGDEVVVAPGTYHEVLSVLPGISVRGASAETEDVCLLGDGTGPIVLFSGASDLEFEGFVIDGSNTQGAEALISLENASPVLRNNTFLNVSSSATLVSLNSDPLIENNLFQDGSTGIVLSDESDASIVGNTFVNHSEAGILVGERCFPKIAENEFDSNVHALRCEDNSAPWITKNVFLASLDDAIVLEHASPSITLNTFSETAGAALSITKSSQPEVLENWFDNNIYGITTSASSPFISSNWFTFHTIAGILVSAHSYPSIVHNIFQDNEKGIELEGNQDQGDASPHIFNNTIVSCLGTGIHCVNQAYPAIGNNIIAYNHAYGVLCEGNSVPTLAYNDFWENSPSDTGGRCSLSETDMSADPEFLAFTDDGAPDNDDLHVAADSPTRNAGNPMPEYNDTDGTRNDLGAYGGPPVPTYVDIDGDGYTVAAGDCNDADPRIYPGAEDVPDGLDNDCDQLVDGSIGDDDTEAGDDDATAGDDDVAGDDDASSGDDDIAGDDDETSAGDDDVSGDDDGTASYTTAPDPSTGEGCNCHHTPHGRVSERTVIHLEWVLVFGLLFRRRLR